MPVGRQPQPHLVERDALDVDAVFTELVEVAMSRLAPVLELDAELEAGLRGLHEVPLVDAEHLVEELQRGDGGFADTDGADFFRLDQRDALRILHGVRQCGSGHPAGRAAADDYVMHGVIVAYDPSIFYTETTP